MTWPRALSISETLWSPKRKKNWGNFSVKVQQHFSRLDMAEVKYTPSIYEPDIHTSLITEGLIKDLQTEIKDIDIYYSVDNSFPDRFYPKYTGTIAIPRGATILRLISYKRKEQVSRVITISVKKLYERAKRK